jgi:iron complex transport system substrate-binding protein
MVRGATKTPRVISLLPAGTDIVAALGAAESLVGISHECAAPASASRRPRVTANAILGASGTAHRDPALIDAAVAERSRLGQPLFTLLESEISALRPEVLITQALCDVCAVSETDVRALARHLTPEPTVVTLSATTLDGVLDDILTVAQALGRRADGAELVATLRARLDHVHGILSASRAPRPRTAVIEWTDPVYAAGHWVPDMVHRSGGVDVLAVPGQHSRQLLWEAVVDASPEIVIIAPCGYDLGQALSAAENLVASDSWLTRRTVWAVDAESLVSRPGPGLVTGIETFAAVLHPGLFPAPPTDRARPIVAA